jgi:hypothetical protein
MLIILSNISFASQMTMEISFNASTNIPGMEIEGQTREEISGEFNYGNNQIKNAHFIFNSKKLTTGMDLRDEHLVKLLKNSNLEFKSSSTCLFKNELCELRGTLFIANEKSDVVVKVQRDEHKFSSELVLKLSQFNIEKPSFAGVSVKDEVTIKVKGRIK